MADIGVVGLEEIQPLRANKIMDAEGTCYGESAPGGWEIMKKINEIAEKVNILLKGGEDVPNA